MTRTSRIRSVALPLILIVAAAVGAGDVDKKDKLRGWDIDAWRAPDSVLEFEATEGTWMSVDVSPDGTQIAFDLLGHLYEMPIAGGLARRLTEGKSWNMYPRYSPDGASLAFTSDREWSNDLWVLTRATGKFENWSKLEHPVFQGTWSRDGRHLYGTALNEKVRMPSYQFNRFAEKQEIIPADTRAPVNHFEEHPDGRTLYFEHADEKLPASGPRIKKYDLETGEVEIVIDRPGGASTPRLSPDGALLAYVHRNDLQTELVVRDLASERDRTILSLLDLGRFEGGGFYGTYPNLAWTPSGEEIVLHYGGGLHAVRVADGSVRDIPFRAPVRRALDETHRVKVPLPVGSTRTRSHRWGIPVAGGVLFEALGDLHLARGTERTNLTDSAAHETNPVYHAATGRLYYATWTDDSMGALLVRGLDAAPAERLATFPTQYGSIAVSPDGTKVAYLRGAGSLQSGTRLEDQTDFELHVRLADGTDHRVTDIRGSKNRYARRPPTVRFSPDGELLYFTEFVGDEEVLTLKRSRLDGACERVLYEFPEATRAVLSPDLRWVAFREFHRSYVAPFSFVGKPHALSAADSKGYSHRIDADEDGDFMEWTDDSSAVYWTRGHELRVKTLDDILGDKLPLQRTDLSFAYDLLTPTTTIALTGLRIITMNAADAVLENATILIQANRIVAVGTDVVIPAEARVFHLPERTVMPGMFDAHGHYGSPISALNVIEQRLYGLHANLAYGVTTMYDVYGTTQKDFWVDDMLRAGKMIGPRLFSVGDPIFVTKYRNKMHRPIQSLEDAEEHARFNKDHGATALKDYSNHARGARQQLIAAARKHGLNLVTESFGDPTMNLTQIIDGYTGIEHTMGLTPLYDDVIRLFAASKIGMTPTLIVVYGGPAGERYFHQTERLWEDPKLLNFYNKSELMHLRRPTHYWDDDQFHAVMGRELLKLQEAGVLLQMGAHGQMMGLGAHWEMELFVRGGFTPYQALRIATINGFHHHGLDHSLGSIEKGKLADLVVMRENPIEDIRNSRSIQLVVKDGVVYSGLDATRVYPDPKPAKEMYFKDEGR